PEIVNALRASEKARTEDDVGAAVEDGLEQLGGVARVVFEIGVLDEDDFAGGFGEAATEGSALALVLRLKEKTQIAEFNRIVAIVGRRRGFAAGLASGETFENLAGAVGGAVIDDEDFLADGGFDDATEDFVDRGLFVVDGDDHGELGVA